MEQVRSVNMDLKQDNRGFFFEAFKKSTYELHGLPTEWLQDNVSFSYEKVLRGMHIQKKNPQGKLVMCLAGQIFDAWVDLRPGSPTFKSFGSKVLKGGEAMYIPPGHAHGFFVGSTYALVHYKCTTEYDKESDGGILWSTCGVEWPFPSDFIPLVSGKDWALPSVDEYLENLG